MGAWKHDISSSLMGHFLWVNMVLSDSHLSHPADHRTGASINALRKRQRLIAAACLNHPSHQAVVCVCV